MANPLTVKLGDRYPTYWHIPANLTGVTTTMYARRGAHPKITLPTTLYQANPGILQYNLDALLDKVGLYVVEVRLLPPDGTEITAPTDTYDSIRVIARV